MNELKRSGKRTREQLTFSDTYLVLDNLREYDFDLVSFYVTFTQYIDRRNYEGRAENSLIFANNEALFKAFNVSRNRFYRLLKLSYECGLIDIEKGSNNSNIYILNDVIAFEPLKIIRDWENRNGQNKDQVKINKEGIVKDEETEAIQETSKLEEKEKTENAVIEKNNKESIKVEDSNFKDKKNKNKGYRKRSCPKKGQPKTKKAKELVIPKKDNQSSQKGITGHPEKGQLSNLGCSDGFNALDSPKNSSNSSKGLIDLSFNSSKSISQSIYEYENNNNINNNKTKKTDRQDRSKEQLEYLYNIFKKCEIHLIEESYKDAVIHAIRLLVMDIENKKIIKIGGSLIPTDLVKNDLKKLSFLIIDHAINKFKKVSMEKEIKNTVAYLKSCIYNSIYEMGVDIDSELRYKQIIYS